MEMVRFDQRGLLNELPVKLEKVGRDENAPGKRLFDQLDRQCRETDTEELPTPGIKIKILQADL